ncbi:hypothetical protein SSPNP10_23195 [Streptomyces sp. NP10]|nr:hypothetical protein SSPNP10_23195 [Streptomyces sp. NP10]
MPLTIGATAIAAWGVLGWPVSVALLVAAVLAPTDPVLASEVRVGEPSAAENDGDEVRFALTSEAGLNDGLPSRSSSRPSHSPPQGGTGREAG